MRVRACVCALRPPAAVPVAAQAKRRRCHARGRHEHRRPVMAGELDELLINFGNFVTAPAAAAPTPSAAASTATTSAAAARHNRPGRRGTHGRRFRPRNQALELSWLLALRRTAAGIYHPRRSEIVDLRRRGSSTFYDSSDEATSQIGTPSRVVRRIVPKSQSQLVTGNHAAATGVLA